MVLVMSLTFVLYIPYLLVRFWVSCPVLFQTVHLKAQVFLLCVDLLHSQVRVLYWGPMQSLCDLQSLGLSG